MNALWVCFGGLCVVTLANIVSIAHLQLSLNKIEHELHKTPADRLLEDVLKAKEHDGRIFRPERPKLY